MEPPSAKELVFLSPDLATPVYGQILMGKLQSTIEMIERPAALQGKVTDRVLYQEGEEFFEYIYQSPRRSSSEQQDEVEDENLSLEQYEGTSSSDHDQM